MHRLQTRPQFQATLAAGTVARTAHFALHRLALLAPASPAQAVTETPAAPSCSAPPEPAALPLAKGVQALFRVVGVPPNQPPTAWLGAMVPKRWARRAVTRNSIRRQIYAVAQGLPVLPEQASPLPPAAHVVRLRAAFDRKHYVSADSPALRQAVRAELLQLFAHAQRQPLHANAAKTGHAGKADQARRTHHTGQPTP